MHTRPKDLADWLRDRTSEAGARGLVISLDGGLDSAVVARLCQMAVGDQALAAVLPCHEDLVGEADARLVAAQFGIPVVQLDLGLAYDQLTADLHAAAARITQPQFTRAAGGSPQSAAALNNVKRRLQMTSLYFLANSLQYLVAGAANRSDLMIGCLTKYGQSGVDLLPLGNLLKSEVVAIARDVEIPAPILEKASRDRLGTAEGAETGFTHAELERYLEGGPEAVAPALALRIERLMRQNDAIRGGAQIPAEGPSAEIDR